MGRAHTTRVDSADCPGVGCDIPQLHLLPPVSQEVCDPPTGGAWYSELGEFGGEDVWDDGVKQQAEVSKQDLCICPWGDKVL